MLDRNVGTVGMPNEPSIGSIRIAPSFVFLTAGTIQTALNMATADALPLWLLSISSLNLVVIIKAAAGPTFIIIVINISDRQSLKISFPEQ